MTGEPPGSPTGSPPETPSGTPTGTRTPAQNAELALLLEVSGTPKPGNVDRHRDHPHLRFEHFMAGAVGAQDGLRLAAEDEEPLGEAFETAVEGMAAQSGGNTQFGALLVLAPLVRAASRDALTRVGANQAAREATVDDAVSFYRAFEHVDVAVGDPPDGLEPLDVRHGGEAEPALRGRALTLYGVMELSAAVDGVAKEWTTGFERTFRAAEWLQAADGPVGRRTSRVFVRLLAEEPDMFVAKTTDRETAREASERARAVLDGAEDAEALADEFVERGINPGTTADLTAGAVFIALERGLNV